jgi:hypothetical protein
VYSNSFLGLIYRPELENRDIELGSQLESLRLGRKLTANLGPFYVVSTIAGKVFYVLLTVAG